MTWLSDGTLKRLQAVTARPDFTGTRYRLLNEIGRGGMGVVYEAEDAALERIVALKVLAADATSPEDVARLRREAQIIAGLEHPGIVPIHDVGETPDGRVYYAMKRVRGDRLDDWARRKPSRSERLRVFLRVCEAVAFAHASGVTHGDLKPGNVMVGEFGAVLLMDWGLARAGKETAATRAVAGTPGWMAPEQVRGETEKIDAFTDVYGLGAVLEFLMEADALVPRPLAAVARKAKSEEKEDRYSTAAALAGDVTRFMDAVPLSAYRESLSERLSRWLGRNRTLVTIVAAYLVMRALVFFLFRR